MSSKVRKPGPNRIPNRQSSRGSRQTASQNTGRPHNKEYANSFGGQSPDPTPSDFINASVKTSIVSLVGCHVQVHTADEEIYDGVLNTISPAFVICLSNAHLQSSGNQKKQEQCHTPNIDELIREISFNLRDIICIKCKNVDLDFARKDLFQTDSMISGSNGPANTERELKPWIPDNDDVHAIGSLEDMADIKSVSSYDDLKRANEIQFNFTSTYNENTMSKYMDEIETHNKEVHQQREREAERIVEELGKEATHKYHDALDSGVSEEEKFSSVKRSGFNSSPNRNSNATSRGRGRSRAPGFLNYRESPSEQATTADTKLNKNQLGSSRRITSTDDVATEKPLYSQLLQRSTQQDYSNQRGHSNEGHQHHSIPYQPPGMQQQQQRQRMQNDAPTHLQQQQKMMPNQNTSASNNSLPPRMQQQQQKSAVTMEASHPQQQHVHANSKPRFEPQSAAAQVGSPVTEQRSASLDNDKEMKKNRDVWVSSAKGGSLDRNNLESSTELQQSSTNDLAKGSPEMSKQMEKVFKDSKGVPRQKFGKVQPHKEEKAPADFDKLKQFSEGFKFVDSKSQKRPNKSPELNQSQLKDTEKQDNDSLVIKLSPDPPVKEEISADRMPPVQKMTIPDEPHEIKDVKKPESEEKEKNAKKSDSNKPEPKTVEEKKPEIEATVVQSSNPTPKSGLNPNAKEFRLNPNAREYVPAITPPPATAATTNHAHFQNLPPAQLYQPPRMVAASSPPVLQGNVQAIPVIQGQGQTRFKGYPVESIMESPNMSSAAIPGMMQQQQHIQQPQQQQQSSIVYLQYPTPLVATIPPQHAMGRHQWHQSQGHQVGHHAQLITPVIPDGNPSMFLVNPPGGHIMAPPQQQQQIHASQLPYSHPPTQSAQQPIQHYMVNSYNSQQYPQMGSPLTSNAQVMQGIQRPPTPSQHSVHSATPPMHPGHQLFYGASQVPAVNIQPQSTFVAAPRNQVQMQTFQ